MVLKAMTYEPTGGIVAAPTTSLPEQIGGVRNWDYRYCWLRDATFALHALVANGFLDEARAWRSWLLRAVAGDPDDLQIMYGPGGERRLTELELPWLDGYEGSKPVRIGNGASDQFQLDVYGEVLDVLHAARSAKLERDEDSWTLQKVLLATLERRWHEPDEGIWEVRGPRRHFTHSKVMAWVAFDRAVTACERFGHDGPVDRWREVRAEIHDEVMERGFDRELGSFVGWYGSKRVDASLLTIPLVGFLPPDHPRRAAARSRRCGASCTRTASSSATSTTRRRAASTACRRARARSSSARSGSSTTSRCSAESTRRSSMFERLLALRNDLGLLSEEYDVETRPPRRQLPAGVLAHRAREHGAAAGASPRRAWVVLRPRRPARARRRR